MIQFMSFIDSYIFFVSVKCDRPECYSISWGRFFLKKILNNNKILTAMV